MRRSGAHALAALAVALAGCTGSFRASTTPRTAEEELLVTTAAERAVFRIDAWLLAGRSVFVDGERLVSSDRGYVLSAFREVVARANARLACDRESADVIIEARSACTGNHDGHWTLAVPAVYVAGVAGVAVEPPAFIEIGYILHEGWARVEAFAYERETGRFLFGWRNRWARAHVSFGDDIYPPPSIGATLHEMAR